MPAPELHRKRLRRYNDPGEAHFLTFSCFKRQPFLSRDRTCRWMAQSILKSLQKHAFHLWAYVLMPEHVHLVVWPTKVVYDTGRFLKSVKQPVAVRAVRFVRKHAPDFLSRMLDRQPNGDEHHRFWQRGGGYDRNLWTTAEVWEKIDYIHNNPVKRGLCERPEDWYWSSAVDFAGIQAGPVPLDWTHLPRL
jgi:putative transposase